MCYSLDEFKTKTPLDIKPHMDAPQFQTLIDPLLKGERPKVKFDTDHQRQDGTIYPVEVHLQLSILGKKQVFVAIIQI